MSNNNLKWGCVADDFTGASDAASFWAEQGMCVLLINGIEWPKELSTKDFDAIVIALKTRTEQKEVAVKETLDACRRLKDEGVKQLFIKYCSTFDSTPEGNIGPILDRILEEYNLPYTILCPALPVNNRKVKDGILYVKDVPLSESPMRNHPLTPMWDSRLKVLMEAQSKYPVMEIHGDILEADEKEVKMRISKFTKQYPHGYIVPDYYEDSHSERIIELFGDLPVLSGGSGLMTTIAKKCLNGRQIQKSIYTDQTAGGALLLAGSCSPATLEQIEDYKVKGNPCYQILPNEWLEGSQRINDVMEMIENHKGENVLVYSSAPPEEVNKTQQYGKMDVAAALEMAMCELGKKCVEKGITRIIVAGGETSGAVTKGLGFSSYTIGSSIAPGVPIMIPTNQTSIRLVLKSGNFGQRDFFTRAVEKTKLMR